MTKRKRPEKAKSDKLEDNDLNMDFEEALERFLGVKTGEVVKVENRTKDRKKRVV